MLKKRKNNTKKIILTILIVALFVLFIIPFFVSLINTETGNVALIKINGVITGSEGSYLGQGTVSSENIVKFLQQAENNNQIKAILIEINSPGGGAVASDEISQQIKKSTKPVISLIREVGASGGYWIASSTNHIIANRMSITGSIGVTSSYLEFSELMKKYGIGYERLVAGDYKDVGTPLKKMTEKEKSLLQSKIDKIHHFFIKEIASNRKLSEIKVKQLATGEIFLGVEAKESGLIDQLGNRATAEEYIKKKTNLEEIDYREYKTQKNLLNALTGMIAENFFKIGEGIGSVFVQNNQFIWV